MRRLHTPEDAAGWLRTQVTGTLRTDSRQVRPGDAFIAWPGQATDGRQYVGAALQAGAAACIVEAEGVEAFGFDRADAAGFLAAHERIGVLPALKRASGALAAHYFGHPGERLTIVAATGTNGKSSTAWWTAQALGLAGRRCGLVGTLGIGEPPRAGTAHALQPTGLTTPDPVTLQAALAAMVQAGFAACAVEASSIGLAEHRLAGTPITVAQFTNFTRDHLDYHRDMAGYWAAKRVLFDWPGLAAAAINIDDEQGATLHDELAQRGGLDLWPCSVRGPARLAAQHLRYEAQGLAFDLVEGGERHAVRSALIGDYNAANLLGVLAALRALGVPLAQCAALVPALSPVPGRMERVAAAPGQPEVVVDYAHTPDALDKALGALRPLAAARGGRLWCVFGCGGDRDATKRPMMGALAHRLADQVVLTSDNPRRESPALILAQILAGISDHEGVDVIEDRRAAIGHAIAQAAAQDVVLVAGKGHEATQEIAGVKLPFADVEVAGAALRQREAAR